jgi:hypothetical protein
VKYRYFLSVSTTSVPGGSLVVFGTSVRQNAGSTLETSTAGTKNCSFGSASYIIGRGGGGGGAASAGATIWVRGTLTQPVRAMADRPSIMVRRERALPG